jgi:hypothetical protein
VILCFAVVGIFTEKWHNIDYLKSIGVVDETLDDRPAIDYSIMVVVLIGFTSEIIYILSQIFASVFCKTKNKDLAKV